MKNAAESPITIFNWLKETIFPRLAAGAISAMYMGAMIREIPTPIPANIRANTKIKKLGATADKIAEKAYNKAEYFKTIIRPYLSLMGPANIIATVAAKDKEATAQPNSIFES